MYFSPLSLVQTQENRVKWLSKNMIMCASFQTWDDILKPLEAEYLSNIKLARMTIRIMTVNVNATVFT